MGSLECSAEVIILKKMIELRATELTGIIGRESMNYLEERVGSAKWHEYRKLYDQASCLEIETDYPLQLDIELNDSCNLKCPMCPLSVETNENKGRETWFKFEKFKEIIEEGVLHGLKALKLNYLNEPLIREDIFDFIAYAKKAGVCDVYLSTNGVLLTESAGKKLIESGLDRIQISIDAFEEETYDEIRPGSDFFKVIKNTETLIRLREDCGSKFPLIRVNFVRTELNEAELEKFIDYWYPKVDMIGIQEMIKPTISSRDLRSETTKKKWESGFSCSFPYKLLTINCEGDILPCCTFYAEKMKLGNIATDSIYEVWRSKPMKALRELHRHKKYFENEICKACVDNSVF